MNYQKKFILSSALILSSFLSGFNAQPQNLLVGEYPCSVVGSKVISDGRGSSLTYRSGKLTVNSEGVVTFKSRVAFNIVGRKPRVETLSFNGTGDLDDLVSGDLVESASSSFSVKPSKKVTYRRSNLVGKANFDIESEDVGGGIDNGDNLPDFGDLAIVKSAQGYITSRIGIVRLACGEAN